MSAGCDDAAYRVLQSAALSWWIHAGIRNRAGGTRRVIVANTGRDSWDVWLDVHTGEGRLRRRKG